MKMIELQKYGKYSVILRLNEKGNPIAIEPFVVACMPRIEDGEVIDWAFGHYFGDLFNAVDFARQKETGMSYYRLEEIASKAIHEIVSGDEVDEAIGYHFLETEIEMGAR